MPYELNFEAEPFTANEYFDSELEVRITIDEPGRTHIEKQLTTRFPDLGDQIKIRNRINQLLGMAAPTEAVGVYEWYVQVGNLRDGAGFANIVVVGHMIRSVLDEKMIVRGTRYVIRSGKLRKAAG